uniref:ACT domain-containing protein n=1 Tax=Ascaris lumbricoides TaxID=6252 RepID=A0A0M3IMK8_ASCLU
MWTAPTGSFKERRACYALLQLSEDDKRKRVYTASAGMVADNRLMHIELVIFERPGSLVELTTLIAKRGAAIQISLRCRKVPYRLFTTQKRQQIPEMRPHSAETPNPPQLMLHLLELLSLSQVKL